MRALHDTARTTSRFSAYYALPTRKPFLLFVVAPALAVSAASMGFALMIYSIVDDATKAVPIFAACLTVAVVALGWIFAGWNSHNTTIRQNTNHLLFARFAHQPFSEALHRFHMRFGHDPETRVTWEMFLKLRKSACAEDKKDAAALVYILNYYDFVASGVCRGDLDKQVVRDNMRGTIEFFHDKCWPIIIEQRKRNPRTFEFLAKMRTHYREP